MDEPAMLLPREPAARTVGVLGAIMSLPFHVRPLHPVPVVVHGERPHPLCLLLAQAINSSLQTK